jgi:hypothetical protein
MAIYDRIDLVAIGTWAKNFRPLAVVLSFGTDLTGGDKHTALINVTLPFGANVGGSVLSTTNCAGGTIVAGGVHFDAVSDVIIPFGTKFTAAMDIGGKSYPTGVLPVASASRFLMQTVQLVDINGKAIFSVHGTETDEQIDFTRPTADIRRLIMYKEGVGIDTPVFACYNIVFKTVVTLAEVKAFNLLHPSDVNPIIIDDGSVKNSTFIIPA